MAESLLIEAFRGLTSRNKRDLAPAWDAWQRGEIGLAGELARQALESAAADEARHLLFLTSMVRGAYCEALGYYRAISASYTRIAELTGAVVEAHIHLAEVGEALDFARGRKGVPASLVRRLADHVRRPLEVNLGAVTAIPFADHPLTEYFPAFLAEINGHAVTAHIDTGGMYLVMGPERAAALGIRTSRAEGDRAHLNLTRVGTSYGIADHFVLGGAVLRNVPVDVLSTLTGEGDLIIFGTSLLTQFLSTMDYPARRLILSKRGDAASEAAHRAMLPSGGAAVPFFLWSDHMMFARGGVGERRDLNFFVDSGLVSLHPDGKGGTRQASFTSSKRKFREWGIPDPEISRGFFESRQPLSLGPLQQEGAVFVAGAAGDQSFGGVRIDGLISHAFLKRYAWTIDFDQHEYWFSR